MEGNPDLPGGSLASKPTWWNTSGCSATSAFFVLAGHPNGDERCFAVRFDIWVTTMEWQCTLICAAP